KLLRPDRQSKLPALSLAPFRHRSIDTLVCTPPTERIDVLVPHLFDMNQCALPRAVLVMLQRGDRNELVVGPCHTTLRVVRPARVLPRAGRWLSAFALRS